MRLLRKDDMCRCRANQPVRAPQPYCRRNPASSKQARLLEKCSPWWLTLLDRILMRNALMGFCEPLVLHQLANRFVSLFNNPISVEIRNSRTDCGGNILHAAIRIAVANKNKDDADPGSRRNPSRDEPSRSTGFRQHFMDPLETIRAHGLAGGNSPLIRNPTMPVEVDISVQEKRCFRSTIPHFSRSIAELLGDQFPAAGQRKF
ncbi:hypothetical protein WR25_06236 [Diploscapter pachys]|uniref:Uncharacterized protein n=1 Tax=Diploscapter pachys TaxID=2018661 RepID=A0A2A2LX22_9BILA|nr:hypothetical protein WR25_06236 [Diploscapter pachys]